MATALYILKQAQSKRKRHFGAARGLGGGAGDDLALRRTKAEREELRRVFKEGLISSKASYDDDIASTCSDELLQDNSFALDSLDEGASGKRGLKPPAPPRGEGEVEHWILLQLREKAKIARIRVRDRRRRRQTIDPAAPWKVAWDMYVGSLIAYSVIVVPWRLAFDLIISRGIAVLDLVVDLSFACDIVLSFFTSYYHEGRRVVSRKKIAMHYLKGWFILDFVSTVPFDAIVALATGSSGDDMQAMQIIRIFRLFRLVKLVRVAKLDKILRGQQVQEILHPGVLKLFSLLFKVVFLSHFVACMWWMLGSGCNDEDQQDEDEKWKQCGDGSLGSAYLASFYWSIVTMMTVGYGDIFSVSNGGRVYTMFVFMAGCAVFGLILATVAEVVQSFCTGDSGMSELEHEIKEFCDQRRLGINLSRRLRSHFSYYYSNPATRKPVEKEALAMLPPSMREELMQATSIEERQCLSRPIAMKYVGREFVMSICEKLVPFALLPGDVLLECGSVPSQVYFLGKGVCHLKQRGCSEPPEMTTNPSPIPSSESSEKSHRLVGVCFDGSELGLYHAVYDQTLPFLIQCATSCDAYFVEASDFVDALALDSTSATSMQSYLETYGECFKGAARSSCVTLVSRLNGDKHLVHSQILLNGVKCSVRSVHPCLLTENPYSYTTEDHFSEEEKTATTATPVVAQNTEPHQKTPNSDFEDVIYGMSLIVKRYLPKDQGQEALTQASLRVTGDSGDGGETPRNGRGINNLSAISRLFPFKYHATTILPVSEDGDVSSAAHKAPATNPPVVTTPCSPSSPVRQQSIRRSSNVRRRSSIFRRPSLFGKKQNADSKEQVQKKWAPPAVETNNIPSGIIDPSSVRKLTWDAFIGLLIVFSFITVPLRLGFDLAITTGWTITDWIMDTLFAADIVVSFHTAYIDLRGGLVVDKRAIRRKYLRGWFVIDFVSTIPIDKIIGWIVGGSEEGFRSLKLIRTLRLIRLLKLVRIMKLGKIKKGIEEYLDTTWLLKSMQLITTLLVFAHFFGCFWAMIAVNEAHSLSSSWMSEDAVDLVTVSSQYLASLYWSVTTLTTVGYGDVIPRTDAERVYAVIVVLLGATLFSYILGNLSALLATGRESRDDTFTSELNYHLMAHNVNRHLTKQLLRQSEYEREHTSSSYGQSWILSMLPLSLREEVALECYSNIIDNPSLPLLSMEWQGYDVEDKEGILARQFVAFVAPMLQYHFTFKGSSIVLPESGPLGVFFLFKGRANLTVRKYYGSGGAEADRFDHVGPLTGSKLVDIPGMEIEPGMTFGFNFMLSTEHELGARALESCTSFCLPVEVLGFVTQRAKFMSQELHLRIKAILRNTLERLKDNAELANPRKPKMQSGPRRKLRRSSFEGFIEEQPDFQTYVTERRVRASDFSSEMNQCLDRVTDSHLSPHDAKLPLSEDVSLLSPSVAVKKGEGGVELQENKRFTGSGLREGARDEQVQQNILETSEWKLDKDDSSRRLQVLALEYIDHWLLNLDYTLGQIFGEPLPSDCHSCRSRLQLAIADLQIDAARHQASIDMLKAKRLSESRRSLECKSGARDSSEGITTEYSSEQEATLIKIVSAFRSTNQRNSHSRNFLEALQGIHEKSKQPHPAGGQRQRKSSAFTVRISQLSQNLLRGSIIEKGKKW